MSCARLRPIVAAVLALVLMTAVACSEQPSSSQEEQTANEPRDITIMSFNIEYGGDIVSFDKVIEAIDTSGASIVGINEGEGNVPKIAEELGWPYVDARRAIISKYPLLQPLEEEEAYTYVELSPGNVVAVGNVHLASSPYGPNLISNKGYTEEEIIANEEKVRIPEIEPVLESFGRVPSGVPRFIMGDLNTPSHRDWTSPEVVGLRPQMKFPVPWPVTQTIEQAQFTDSFRFLHPDVVEDEGLTWPSERPDVKGEWNPPKDANQDRIDFIFSGPGAKPLESFLMGEEGGPGVERSVTPWPSDHRALISSFELDGPPAPPPTLVAVQNQMVPIGEPLEVRFHAPSGSTAIVASPVADDAAPEIARMSIEGETDGAVTFDTSTWDAAEHWIQLLGPDRQIEAATRVYLLDPETGPTISTDRPSYRSGQAIGVEWYGAPANRWDWVGTFEQGAKNGQYIQYEYTDATVAGTTKINGGSPGSWPLPPGKYSVRLLLDDGYKSVAEADFTVKG